MRAPRNLGYVANKGIDIYVQSDIFYTVMSIETMREISGHVANGKRFIMFTQFGIHAFKSNREACKHPAWKNAHITLQVRDIAGGLYVDTTAIFGKV